MDFEENMIIIRKKKGLSQADLGKMIGTSGDVIGRYERGDIRPSIEMVSKIVDDLKVSLDYLIRNIIMLIDKPTLKPLEVISNLPEESKSFVLNLIEIELKDFKAKKALI